MSSLLNNLESFTQVNEAITHKENSNALRLQAVEIEIDYLEENWDHFPEHEAEDRHQELGQLQEGVKPSYSYYRELHPGSVEVEAAHLLITKGADAAYNYIKEGK